MAQIGTIRLQTQNNGTVSVPVFNTGDSGSSVYEFVRVQTASGTGFIPLVDTTDSSYPYLRVQSQNHGIVAVHDSATAFAIPDSEANQKLIHRWLLNDVNGSVADSVGSATGANNGVVSVEGDYAGGSAGDGGTGDNYIATASLGSFGSNLSTDHAIAFSVDSYAGGDFPHIGIVNTGSSGSVDCDIQFDSPSNGAVSYRLRDSTGDIYSERTDSGGYVDDQQPHRIVINKTANTGAGGIDIWVDKTNVQSSIVFDQGFDTSENFTHDYYLFARNNAGSVIDSLNAVLDDYCIFNDSLTQSEIESYTYPWS